VLAQGEDQGAMTNDLCTIICGDALAKLRDLPDESAQCCVTSPPYWGLRDYGVDGQLGLEKTPEEYVAKLVEVLREVRRVLRKDGTLWLNLGDSHSSGGRGSYDSALVSKTSGIQNNSAGNTRNTPSWTKPKDLIGIPWMVAFALRADGWWLRSEITWCKKVPMPESVQDRPTSATEKVFLLTKSNKYYYDAKAVRNPPSESWANDPRWQTGSTQENIKNGYEESGAQNPKRLHRMFDKQSDHGRRHAGFNERWDATEAAGQCASGSNMRNYWVLGPEPCAEAHFATFPTKVPKKCILAGSRPSDVILDPFAGSGTTGMVALELGRKVILIELNTKYVELIKQRCDVTPGLLLVNTAA
jgi:DNA modification methylase